MTSLLPDPPLLAAFLVASVVLAVTPGPGVVYIVTRSLVQGRRAGLASVAGVAIGNLGSAIGAAVGLAALFAASSLAFSAVKFAGAAYLVYLGVKALRAPAADHAAPLPGTAGPWRILRSGAIVALLNPKTVLFFAAFLPQFMNPAHAPIPQSLLLGALFVAIAAVTDSAYALAAGTVAPRLARFGRAPVWGRRASACTYIGLGVYTAASGSRGAT
jgi:threonine/homoserine/homoserine lactone efflux protein